MSPFAAALRQARFRKGLRQQDLADLVGCERSYVSALENDLKLAPPAEFVARMSVRLNLTTEETGDLQQARRRSRRRYDVPPDVPPDSFELVYELFDVLRRLSEEHRVGIRAMLKLGPTAGPTADSPDGRLRRRDRAHVEEEPTA